MALFRIDFILLSLCPWQSRQFPGRQHNGDQQNRGCLTLAFRKKPSYLLPGNLPATDLIHIFRTERAVHGSLWILVISVSMKINLNNRFCFGQQIHKKKHILSDGHSLSEPLFGMHLLEQGFAVQFAPAPAVSTQNLIP